LAAYFSESLLKLLSGGHSRGSGKKENQGIARDRTHAGRAASSSTDESGDPGSD